MNRIKCKETGEIFTIYQLSKNLGCAFTTVSDLAKQCDWEVDGKTYHLVDEHGDYTDDYTDSRTLPVNDIKTSKVYQSLRNYAKHNGVSREAASRWAKKQYKIRFLTEDEMNEIHYASPSGIPPKAVIEVSTGKIWGSTRACARDLCSSDKTVASYIAQKKKLYDFYLEYLDVYNEQYTDEEKAFLKGLK